jgi:ribosome maturation factor RimP
LTVEEVRMGAEQEIVDALSPAVRAAGLEIWDVERSGASVRVLVERAGGVDLDSISQLSRALSAVLDGRDDLVPAGRYVLEVSSPGLERRLRSPSHFSRYVGQEVTVRRAEAIDGTRRLRGTLTAATDEAITVRAEGPDGKAQEVSVPLGSIERANAVFTWGQPVKGGQSKKGAHSTKGALSKNGLQSERSVTRPAEVGASSDALTAIPAGGSPGGVG